MHFLHISTFLAIGGLTVAQNCSTGAVVYAVRGSDPNQNSLAPNPNYNQLPQGMIDTATAVVNKAGGASTNSYYTAVPYPAINPSSDNIQNGMYAQSVAIGVNETQYLISGQGGQVVSSALGGCTPGFCSYEGVNTHGRVAGAVVFADPAYVNQVFPIDNKAAGDGGAVSATTNTVNGTVSNNTAQYELLNQNFKNSFRSYCQSGDAYCNSAYQQTILTAGLIHYDEPQTYASDASAFLTNLV